MSGFFCMLMTVVSYFLNIYTVILFVYAILSWFPDLRRWMYYLAPVVEPVLAPLRRVIPPLGGFDLSFLVLILVLQLLIKPMAAHAAFNACVPY